MKKKMPEQDSERKTLPIKQYHFTKFDIASAVRRYVAWKENCLEENVRIVLNLNGTANVYILLSDWATCNSENIQFLFCPAKEFREQVIQETGRKNWYERASKGKK